MVYRYDIESRKTKKSLAIITLIFVLEKSKNAGTVETLVFEKENPTNMEIKLVLYFGAAITHGFKLYMFLVPKFLRVFVFQKTLRG